MQTRTDLHAQDTLERGLVDISESVKTFSKLTYLLKTFMLIFASQS